MNTSPIADRASNGWPRLLVVGSFLPGFKLERYAGGNLAVEIANAGGKVITTSARRWQALRLADMLLTAYQHRRNYDIAHITVFSGRAFIYAECLLALLARLGKPCTLSLHGGNLPDFSSRYPRRVRRLLTRAAFVVCPSAYLFEQMKPYRQDLHLIPNAVHVANYPMSARTSSNGRLLWLRAFARLYNPAMAVTVLQQVRQVFPQASMTMVGPDKGDGAFQSVLQQVRDLGLQEHVSFPGPIAKSEVPRIMAQHDVFVNTTFIDNTPVSVIEAMACGLPVVSTNVGGIPYLLEHGKTGLLVEPAKCEQMAQAILRVLSEPSLARSLSENGRRLAETFDWNIALPQWRQLFSQVVSGALAPHAA
jgi:glycosyltransferase involved in cell wall biosynthesis